MSKKETKKVISNYKVALQLIQISILIREIQQVPIDICTGIRRNISKSAKKLLLLLLFKMLAAALFTAQTLEILESSLQM